MQVTKLISYLSAHVMPTKKRFMSNSLHGRVSGTSATDNSRNQSQMTVEKTKTTICRQPLAHIQQNGPSTSMSSGSVEKMAEIEDLDLNAFFDDSNAPEDLEFGSKAMFNKNAKALRVHSVIY